MTTEIYGYDKQTGVEILQIKDGDNFRYEKGNHKLHREDGPAIIRLNGAKEWYRNGELHRMDGPAIERPNGTKEWYQLGIRHREDGPAVELSNGENQWYWEGIQMANEEEFIKFKNEDGGAFRKIVDSHLVIPPNVKPRYSTLSEEELLIVSKMLNIRDNNENLTKKPKI